MCAIKPLEIDTRQEGAAVVVTLSGHVTTPESQVVSEAFDRIIADGALRIIVDMTRVDIITSDGLGSLIRARKSIADSGGFLVLCGLEGNIRSLFKMTRLDKIFTLYGTVDEAISAISS